MPLCHGFEQDSVYQKGELLYIAQEKLMTKEGRNENTHEDEELELEKALELLRNEC